MRYETRRGAPAVECDMTPMIDMTFQLVAFLMIMVNFTDAEQSQLIHLPRSELAKPPDVPFENPITLQLTKDGQVLFVGELVPVENLQPLLRREYDVMEAGKKGSAKKSTVIIRADRAAKAGRVKEVIKVCQKTGFEKFALRAKQEEPSGST
jgi:biopolymer transport protein ExbD